MTRASERELRRGESASWGDKPAHPATRIRKFSPYRNAAGTLLGFLSVERPSGLIINNCKLMVGPQGRRWIGMPAVKQLAPDGSPRLGPDGKPVWNQIVEFRDRAIRDRFDRIVLAALRAAHPEAFGGEGEPPD